MRQGMDIELIRAVCDAVSIPVIAGGGYASASDAIHAAEAGVSAVAVAGLLHYGDTTVPALKQEIVRQKGSVRLCG